MSTFYNTKKVFTKDTFVWLPVLMFISFVLFHFQVHLHQGIQKSSERTRGPGRSTWDDCWKLEHISRPWALNFSQAVERWQTKGITNMLTKYCRSLRVVQCYEFVKWLSGVRSCKEYIRNSFVFYQELLILYKLPPLVWMFATLQTLLYLLYRIE